MAKSKSSENSLALFGNMSKLNNKPADKVKNEGLTSSKTPQKFHVTFLNDSDVFTEFDIEEGENIAYPTEKPEKAADSMFNYHFKGWDKSLTTIKEDTVIRAEYEKEALSFQVSFQVDDVTLQTESVTYGNLALAPAIPIEKEDDDTYRYTFTGWEPSLSIPITAPTTFTATFSKTELPKEPEVIVAEAPMNAPEQVVENSLESAKAEPVEAVPAETAPTTEVPTVEPAAPVKETDETTVAATQEETDKNTKPAKAKVGRPATKKGIAKKVNVLFTEDTMEIINTAKVFFDGNMTKYLETLIMEDYKKNKELYDTLARTKRV